MARLVGVDLPRDKRIEVALTYIYGIGPVSAVLMMISYAAVLWRRVKERGTRKEETA